MLARAAASIHAGDDPLYLVDAFAPGRSAGAPARKWRNWQTHQLEGLAVAIPWGFESPLPHQTTNTLCINRLPRSWPAVPYLFCTQ